MSVLIISNFHFSQYKAGAEHYAHQIACSASTFTQVAYLSTSPPTSNQTPYPYLQHSSYSFGKNTIPNIRKIIQFDVSPYRHIHLIGSGLLPLFFLMFKPKLSHQQWVYSTLAPYSRGSIAAGIYSLLEYHLLIRKVDAVTSLTQFNAKNNQIKYPHKSITVLQPSITKPQKPAYNMSAHQSLLLPKNIKHILLVAKLDSHHYYKGVDIAIQAMSQLSAKYHLTIIGDGEQKKFYQHLAAKSSKTKNITFIGQVDNKLLANYYRQADVTILPSISPSEGFGIVLIESLSQGTPIITTSVVGLSKDLKSPFAQIIPPSDSVSLAKAIEKVNKTTAIQKKSIEFSKKFLPKYQINQLKRLYSYA